MRKIYALLLGVLLSGTVEAQTLSQLPQPTGGDPVGIWEADQTPLQIYIPPEILAAISTFTLNGSVSGKVTFDSAGNHNREYVVRTLANATLFIGPIVINRADTQQTVGSYRVDGTNLILESGTDVVVRDTLGFSVSGETLCLFPAPTDEANIITRFVPDASPPLPILKFQRTGTPETPPSTETPPTTETLAGDFDGSGKVDFADFLGFAQHFGTRSDDANFNAIYDIDSSGAVDFPDFLVFAQQFGQGS